MLFRKLILHYPDRALGKLEEVSYLLKHPEFKEEEFLNVAESRNYKELTESLEDYIKKISPFFEKPQAEEEGEEPPELAPVGNVPNLLVESKVYEWAGIGFGEQETYRIMLSMKKLATDSGAGNLRFFGKIFGT